MSLGTRNQFPHQKFLQVINFRGSEGAILFDRRRIRAVFDRRRPFALHGAFRHHQAY